VKIHGAFRRQFSCQADGISVAPGRVNLIGEHTDYNQGFVLPMNVERQTRTVFRPRADGLVRVFSEHAGEGVEFAVALEAACAPQGAEGLPRWARYVAHVTWVLAEIGLPIGGMDAYISSSVPVGGGLSSSASLECSVAAALLASAPDASGKSLDELLRAAGKTRADLALLCQKAEHRTGALCGIMDQFVVLHGTAGRALLLDCRTLEATSVPVDDRLDVAVVVTDSRAHHDLAAAEYNQRRRECEAATRFFAEHLPRVEALRDVSLRQWRELSPTMDPLLARRSKHVVSENERTALAAALLQRGDLTAVGRLMYESHESLRRDYEVSCRELDLLVDVAEGVPGVYGSRMTGGGFGGCTVTLCRKASVEALRTQLLGRYRAATGIEPDVLVTSAADRAEIQWGGMAAQARP